MTKSYSTIARSIWRAAIATPGPHHHLPIPTSPVSAKPGAFRSSRVTGTRRASDQADYAANEVTFVYKADERLPAKQVAVVGTFATLYQPLPLKPIHFLDDPTGYFALTVVLPIGQRVTATCSSSTGNASSIRSIHTRSPCRTAKPGHVFYRLLRPAHVLRGLGLNCCIA